MLLWAVSESCQYGACVSTVMMLLHFTVCRSMVDQGVCISLHGPNLFGSVMPECMRVASPPLNPVHCRRQAAAASGMLSMQRGHVD